METTGNHGQRAFNAARSMVDAIRPLISQQTLRLKGLLGRHGSAETAAAPTLVTMEIGGRRIANATSGTKCRPRGVLGRFFDGVGLPSRSDWLRALGEVPHGAVLRLSGGESLKSPHLEAILFEADGRCLETEVVTDGTNLADCAPVLYGLGVATVRVVFFGCEELHDRMVGRPGAFERAVRGALALRSLRCGTARPTLLVHVVMGAGERGWLGAMIESALAMGADHVVVQHRGSSTGPCRAKVSQGCSAEATSGAPEANAEKDTADELRQVRRTWRRDVVRFFPPLDNETVSAHLFGLTGRRGPSKCSRPWRTLTIGVDGSVRFCEGEIVGNMREEVLSQIYNGDAARAFRRRVRTGLVPSCAGCPGRFGGEDFGV